ncbi:uncharacterized protein LOC111343582, partial [Stylophora pistillata]|uniref:uncharacterized protein LOC111343582 n=1 Tax=Stylophora pistillata TaxID=50429 RepID=UPI000C03DEC0
TIWNNIPGGIPEVKDENTDDILMKVGSLIGLELTRNDISVSHRLPKGSYSAAVRGGCKTTETRDHFYKGRKHLRDKSTRDLGLVIYWDIVSNYDWDNKIYISENLTQAKKDLFKESLKVRKGLKYKFIWTFYGRTYLRKDSESPVVALQKKSDLDILKQEDLLLDVQAIEWENMFKENDINHIFDSSYSVIINYKK